MRFTLALMQVVVATAILVPILTIGLLAIGEGPVSELRFHSRSSDTWPVQNADGPPPTVEQVRDHAVRYCEYMGVESLADSFYTHPTAVIAAHEYAEEGAPEGGPYREALYGGCLAGLISANPSET